MSRGMPSQARLLARGALLLWAAGAVMGCGETGTPEASRQQGVSRSTSPSQLVTLPDIDVLYIQKTPLLNYDAPNGGWPTPGTTVTWNAKVKNLSTSVLPAFTCEWWLDGLRVQTVAVNGMGPGETLTLTLPWTWDQGNHTLELRADTGGSVSEASEANNQYSIRTNSLTVGFWVEQSLYDYFRAHQLELGDGANSFEDWAYRQTRVWNDQLASSVWPASPKGVLDRVRIEKIVVVPDQALPLNGGLATNNPDALDKTVDLMWGFPYHLDEVQPQGYWRIALDGPFNIEYGTRHELNHARYIVDHYGFDVAQNAAEPYDIQVRDQAGNLVAGTALMPFVAYNRVYDNKAGDIMGSGRADSEYLASTWNRKAGIRGPYGNQNAPGDIGVYLNDLPAQNLFRFVDNSGLPLVGATVSVYQATRNPSGSGGWYYKYFDATPDVVATTDADGVVNLGRCPFDSSTGVVTHTYGLSNATFILRIQQGSAEYFTFGEVSDFNLEYWKGNTQSARYTVLVPWGPTSTATVVAPAQWRQEIHASRNLLGAVDVKALNADALGGFALKMGDRPVSSGVGRNDFGMRFERDVWLNKGTYTFYTHTDDGVRLRVGGTTYVDDWTGGNLRTNRAAVTVSAPSLQRISMDYFEASKNATAALAIVPPTATDVGASDWRLDIFGTPDLKNPVEVSSWPENNGRGFTANWGPRAPGPTAPADGFSVRFTRKLYFSPATHTFTLTSDDGARLYIDGVLVLDSWGPHPPSTETIYRSLSGNHAVQVEMRDLSGDAQVALGITTPPTDPCTCSGPICPDVVCPAAL